MEFRRRKRSSSSDYSSSSSFSWSSTIGSLAVVVLLFSASPAHGFTMNNRTAARRPLVPALLAFGDSIVDPGNNNALFTPARCDFPPYGQDFIHHTPTGRFSNGLIPTDMLASGLGIKQLLPPYLGIDLPPQEILTGVSFASGGTGYDALTTQIMSVISMAEELKMFAEYKERLTAIAGQRKSEEIISQALFIVCAGTNDFALNYFGTPSSRRLQYDIPSYVDLLISYASEFIKQLYDLGARKIGFIGLPPIGCVPSQRTLGGGLLRECDGTRNQAAQLYNTKIQTKIQEISKELTGGGNITYFNMYNILLDLIQRPEYYGFKESTRGCCGTGEIEFSLLCNSVTATTCANVTEYVFWDSFHPTEKAYKVLANYILENIMDVLL